ncbi:MAG: Fe-S cluster assembly protein SufD [Stackebrandtia sp.]
MTIDALARPHSHGAGESPPKTKSQLLRSYDPADFPALNGREEEWRFTPLRRLRGLHDGTDDPADSRQWHYSLDLPDGVTAAGLDLDAPHLPETPDFDAPEPTPPARGGPITHAGLTAGHVLKPFDRVSARAYQENTEATVFSVARNAAPDRPAVITRSGKDAERTEFHHAVLDVGEGATAVVVLDQQGSLTLADNLEVAVGDCANLTLVTVTDWARDAVQAQHVAFRIGRDAKVRHIQVTLGGDLVRQYTSAKFTAPGGEIDASGIYFADAGQHIEHRLLVDHAAPDCRSNVNYRGALQGEDAHTVWVGDVLIQAAATGTDTFELNRNLVLTDGARADSVPNLEIETGEIANAGHASATGRFDDEQLFYLQSRGIPEAEARRLVVRGFFNELLQQIPVESLRERLHASIESRLDKAGE